MPTCGDPNFKSFGFLTGKKVINISIPCFLSDNFRVSLFTAFDQVVPNHAVSTVTGDAGQDTGRHPLTAVGQGPFVSRSAFIRKRMAKDAFVNVLLSNGTSTAAKLAGQVSTVGCDNNIAVTKAAHVVGRKDNRRINAVMCGGHGMTSQEQMTWGINFNTNRVCNAARTDVNVSINCANSVTGFNRLTWHPSRIQ